MSGKAEHTHEHGPAERRQSPPWVEERSSSSVVVAHHVTLALPISRHASTTNNMVLTEIRGESPRL